MFANFYSASNFALFLNRLMPLLLIGLGVILSFRAGVFNVGGEGQLYLGAVGRDGRCARLPGLPRPVGLGVWRPSPAWPSGPLYGSIPGALKVRLGVNEVVSHADAEFHRAAADRISGHASAARPCRLRRGELHDSLLRLASGNSRSAGSDERNDLSPLSSRRSSGSCCSARLGRATARRRIEPALRRDGRRRRRPARHAGDGDIGRAGGSGGRASMCSASVIVSSRISRRPSAWSA